MRMSVTLEKELLEEAQALLGKRTKREVIEEALRELIRRKRRDEAVRHAGKIKMDIDLKELIRLRGEG